MTATNSKRLPCGWMIGRTAARVAGGYCRKDCATILPAVWAALLCLSSVSLADVPVESGTMPSEERAAFLALLTSRQWKDRNIRRAILEAALASGIEECSGLIADSLTDQDPGIRRRAIEGLKHCRWINGRVVNGLLANVNGEDRGCRVSALRIVGLLEDPRAGRAVIKALEHADSDMRKTALTCLSERRKQTVPAELLDSLIRDKEEAVRIACVRVIARNRPKGWEEYARLALADSSIRVRSAAVGLCVGMKIPGLDVSKLTPLLRDKDPQVRALAAMIVPSFDGNSLAILQEMTGDPAASVRRALAVAAWYLPPQPAASLLGKLLDDPEESVRLMVLRRSTRLDTETAVALLSRACRDRNTAVALTAAELLLRRDRAKGSEAAGALYVRPAVGQREKEKLIGLAPQLTAEAAIGLLWKAIREKEPNIRARASRSLPHCDITVITTLLGYAKECGDPAAEAVLRECFSKRRAQPATRSVSTAPARGGRSDAGSSVRAARR